jgi:hypothetical protein
MSDGSGPGASPDAGAPDGAPTAPCTFAWQVLPLPQTPADYLTLLNTQGAAGYRHHADLPIGVATYASFVHDDASGATFAYELLDQPASQADFLTQATSEGARGFRPSYIAEIGTAFKSIYVNDSTVAGPYTYEQVSDVTTSADFLAQANGEGQRGFSYFGVVGAGTTAATYYVHDGSGATYSYEVGPGGGATEAAIIAAKNAEGARGFRMRSGARLDGQSDNVYEKQASRAGAYSYETAPFPATPADVAALLTTEGAKGFRFDGTSVDEQFKPIGIFVDMSANACGQGLDFGSLAD